VNPLGQDLAQSPDAGNRLRHERLPRVPGVDAHAEDEVDEPAGDRDDVVGLCLGIEGDTDTEPQLARLPDHVREVVAGLVVDGDAVAPRLRDLPEMLLRALDHEVAVEGAAEPVDDRRDRLEDDGADRDRLDEVPVTDVEMEDPSPGLHERLELLAET
jgi:hypothetical protein